MTFTDSIIVFLRTIVTGCYDTLRRGPHMACVLIAVSAMLCVSASAWGQQTVVRYVNIGHDIPPSEQDGLSWTTSYRFLQDAIADAEEYLSDPEHEDHTVEIWVAAAWDGEWDPEDPPNPIRYRPDQSKDNQDPDHPNQAMQCTPDLDLECCPPYGNCNHLQRFEIPANVHVPGAFPPDPHTWNNNEGAELEDRDVSNPAYETVLDGDRFGGDIVTPHGGAELAIELESRDFFVVRIAGYLAVLDGVTIRGQVHISGAEARLHDCIFEFSEGPALRCSRGSSVQIWRSTFRSPRPVDEAHADILIADGAEVFVIDSCHEHAAPPGGRGRDRKSVV